MNLVLSRGSARITREIPLCIQYSVGIAPVSLGRFPYSVGAYIRNQKLIIFYPSKVKVEVKKVIFTFFKNEKINFFRISIKKMSNCTIYICLQVDLIIIKPKPIINLFDSIDNQSYLMIIFILINYYQLSFNLIISTLNFSPLPEVPLYMINYS